MIRFLKEKIRLGNTLLFSSNAHQLWMETGADLLACIITERQGNQLHIVASHVKEIGLENRDISAEIENFLSQNGLSGIKTVCVLPNAMVYPIAMTFPQMTAMELKKAAQLSLSTKLGINREEICFDFTCTRRSIKGKKMVDVAAVAAKQSQVQTVIDAVEGAGCYVDNVTVALPQYGKLLGAFDDTTTPATSLVIDIGKDSAWFAFFDEGKARYYRQETKIGERQMLSSVTGTISLNSEAFQLSDDEAKKMIQRYGIAQESGNEDITGKSMPLFQFHSMLRPYSEWMVAIARNAVARYAKEFEGAEVQSIFLTGRGAYMKGLDKYLERKLKITTAPLPTQNITFLKDVDDEQHSALSQLTALAALPSCKFSLLPKNAVINKYAGMSARVAALFLVVLFGILAVFCVKINSQTSKYTKVLARTASKLNLQVDTQLGLEDLELIQKKNQWYQKTIQELPTSCNWLGILGDIGRLMFPNMKLNSLAFSRSAEGLVLELKGITFKNSPVANGMTFEFAKQLKTSPFIQEVVQVHQRENDRDTSSNKAVSFEIKCLLRQTKHSEQNRSVRNKRLKDSES